MTHRSVIRARSLLGRLIDPDVPSVGSYLEITAEERADQVRARLAAAFQEKPELPGLTLRLDGHSVGVATPERVRSATGTAGQTPEFGASDRAGLPGHSQQFKAIHFACPRAGCGCTAVLSYYDSRTVPMCTTPAHGSLVLQR